MASSIEFTMRRVGNQFEMVDPDEEVQELVWKLVPLGEEAVFSLKKGRNPRFHNLAMSFFKEIFANQDRYDVFEDFLTEVKLRCGHYTEHVTVKGVVIYIPKSVSFSEMKELEFQAFMKKAIDVCLKHFCQGWKEEDLRRIATRL